ncbi:MAG: transketolase C-terminal domain-containing protein [Planctomycetota bacterium]|nr:transketolase C-terminal domain-containing protein [Planctomycetota bacterium]
MLIGESIGLEMGKATRDAFGHELEKIGHERAEVVVIDGDVGNSTRTEYFAKSFPDRFFNVGIAESNLVSMAGGFAANGKIPVVASFAAFLMCNSYDQIRMSVAFTHSNVKLVGSHAGISIGEDGPSQMGIEDVALACALPGMTVIVPADEPSARVATRSVMDHIGPCYLRVGRPSVPVVYNDGCSEFCLGKAIQLRDGKDVTLIANGLMVAMAMEAAELLAQRGVECRVLDMHTVKPIDQEAVAEAVGETGAIVVAEEHLQHGGLGAVVAYAASQLSSNSVPFRYVNLGDQFAESGPAEGLLEKYHLTTQDIFQAAISALESK